MKKKGAWGFNMIYCNHEILGLKMCSVNIGIYTELTTKNGGLTTNKD
jgi:hypothetical protein